MKVHSSNSLGLFIWKGAITIFFFICKNDFFLKTAIKNTCRTVCKYLSFSQDFKFILQSRNVTRLFQMEDLTWSAAVTWEPRASTTVPKVTSQRWRIKSYTVVTMETGEFKWKNSVSTSLVLIGKVKQCNYSRYR